MSKSSEAVVKQRYVDIATLLVKLREELPEDALRIEVDIEYQDGGRVKMETRA